MKKYVGTKNHRYGFLNNVRFLNSNISIKALFCIVWFIVYPIINVAFVLVFSNVLSELVFGITYTVFLLFGLAVMIVCYYACCARPFWSKDWHQIETCLNNLDKRFPDAPYRQVFSIKRDGEWYYLENKELFKKG